MRTSEHDPTVESRQGLATTSEELSAILNAVHDGITVQAPSGELLWANQAAARLIGFESAEALLSASVEEIISAFEVTDAAGNPIEVADLPGRRALLGEDPPELVLRYRIRATGEEHVSAVKAHPILDDSGAVRFAVNVFRNVTEQHRALEDLRRSEARLAFIAATGSKLLAASIDYRQVLERVADVLVPQVADYCSILEVDDDGSLQRAVSRHADPSRTALVQRLLEYPAGGRTDQMRATIASRQSQLFSEIPLDLLRQAAVDEEHLELLMQVGMRSAIVVPLFARNRPIGALSVATAESGRTYTESDRTLVEDLARRASIAIDNARLYEERANVARTLQQSLLPPDLPQIPGIDLAARYVPAAEDIGGDFYDAFPLSANRWMIVLGDVCGKGPDAAALTSMVRFTTRAAAIHYDSLTEIFADVNRALLPQVPAGRFCTAVAAILEPHEDGATITVATAGHPLPLHLDAAGNVAKLGSEGVLLAVLPEIAVTEHSVRLGRGEAVAFFTDGALNEPDPTRATAEERLTRVLRDAHGGEAHELARAIEEVARATRRPGREDDVAVLVARVR